jgi:hypothetical protein
MKMTIEQPSDYQGIDKFLRNPNIDEYIFFSLIAASFVGEIVLEASLLVGFYYWLAVTPVFFLGSIFSEKAKAIRTGSETAYFIKYGLYYWGSAFVAVLLVFFLWDTNRVAPSAASTFIHIILAHTMFLSGIVLGLRFYLIGILLFATAALNIITQYSLSFSLDLVVIVFIAWSGLKIKNQYILPILKRKSDFNKSESDYSGEERRVS